MLSEKKRANLGHRFLIFFCLCLGAVQAQTDTTARHLPVVDIASKRVLAEHGAQRVIVFDSAALQKMAHAQLGDLLALESGVFIKSYGLGSSATSAIRGGSAGHTLLLWNGLPIGNPMLGQSDLSLIPLGGFDRASVTFGGNAALWGSGALGGVISLQNKADFRPVGQLEYAATFGGFEQKHHVLNVKKTWKNLSFAAQGFAQSGQNDFPYRIRPDLPPKVQTHARLEQRGLQGQAYWRPATRHVVALHLWQQNARRQIPPLTTQNRSTAGQNDAFARGALHWQYASGRAVWQSRVAYFDEQVLYGDTLFRIFTKNSFQTGIAEMEADVPLGGSHRVQMGVHASQNRANTDYYAATARQTQVAAFANWGAAWRGFRFQAALRQAWFDGNAVPLIPQASVRYRIGEYVSCYIKAGRNFRLPTLNDRFWQPGGNINLRPEQGWSKEIGFRLAAKWFSLESSAYDRRIRDWILWSPVPGTLFWGAGNVAAVHSRGLEQRVRAQLFFGKNHVVLHVNHDLARSTNEVALAKPRIEVGQQLFYTPVHQASAGLSWRRGGLEATYAHKYTGSVTGLNEALPAYDIGQAELRYTCFLWRVRTSAFFKVHNIGNRSYRVIERTPMPGRWFQGGASFDIKHEKRG